jgi:hypothetical protein
MCPKNGSFPDLDIFNHQLSAAVKAFMKTAASLQLRGARPVSGARSLQLKQKMHTVHILNSISVVNIFS